jgi:hypothetical protein
MVPPLYVCQPASSALAVLNHVVSRCQTFNPTNYSADKRNMGW